MDIILHPPYSSGPLDYNLFCSFQNQFITTATIYFVPFKLISVVKLTVDNNVKLERFFLPIKTSEQQIMILPERCQKVIKQKIQGYVLKVFVLYELLVFNL